MQTDTRSPHKVTSHTHTHLMTKVNDLIGPPLSALSTLSPQDICLLPPIHTELPGLRKRLSVSDPVLRSMVTPRLNEAFPDHIEVKQRSDVYLESLPDSASMFVEDLSFLLVRPPRLCEGRFNSSRERFMIHCARRLRTLATVVEQPFEQSEASFSSGAIRRYPNKEIMVFELRHKRQRKSEA